MAQHFLNVPGAQTLDTNSYKRAADLVERAVAHEAIVVILGDPGVGKTFAVEDTARGIGLEHHRLVFTRQTTEKSLLAKLIEAVTGVAPQGTQVELERHATELLTECLRLFWIDEAQDLSLRCVEYLRFFYDNVGTRVALVLSGGYGCWANLSRFPMLERRIAWSVELRPLSLTQVLTRIPSYHRIYANADPDLLRRIDGELTHGNLGQWALFTATALDIMREAGIDNLDERVVDAALTLCRHSG